MNWYRMSLLFKTTTMHYIRISMFLILSLRAYLGLNGQESDQLKSYEVKILESNLAKKADSTVAKKGVQAPLRESMLMYDSIKSEVVEE